MGRDQTGSEEESQAEPGCWPVGPGDAEGGWGHPAQGQGRLEDRCGQGLSDIQGDVQDAGSSVG